MLRLSRMFSWLSFGIEQLRFALAGEAGHVDDQLVGLDQASVRGDAVALVEEDHVAGNQFLCRCGSCLSVTHDRDQRGQHSTEAVHDPLAPVLLDVGERCVQQHDAEESDGDVQVALTGIELLRDDGERAADHEQHCKEVPELQEELDDLRCALTHPEFVGAVLLQSPGGLVLGQSAGRTAQPGRERGERKLMCARHENLRAAGDGSNTSTSSSIPFGEEQETLVDRLRTSTSRSTPSSRSPTTATSRQRSPRSLINWCWPRTRSVPTTW